MANTWGYGAMTNHLGDIQNAKSIIVFGANPAVNHPVGFKNFLKAKEFNNAQLIVVDPRYTKTAAKADIYAHIRPGTDIPFMYGMLHIIFKNGWEDKDFIKNRVYGMDKIIKESKNWTPSKVADVTGVSEEILYQITRAFATRKPGTLIWAMGLTQHSIGSSNTRMAPILQLALGNMGVAGGGCNILRGHDNVQGATDMCCLSHSLPGYYGLSDGSWKYFAKQWGVDYNWLKGRFKAKKWMNGKGFTLARWYEGVIKEDPVHSSAPIKALWVQGNGITSIARQASVQKALDKLELIVVAEPFANEAAIITNKQDGVYILPTATQFENEGTVTATNRTAQWRSRVVAPMYESKTDQDIMFTFAKKFGFFNEFVAGMKLKANKAKGTLEKVKDNFNWPDDAVNEVARTIKTIGLTGWTADRLKRHQKNWHMFNGVTIAGMGPMEGEYYGLPWPCWTTKHSGSPILYDINLSVAQGGMGFRNRFGLEHDGVDLLAGPEATIKDAKIVGGYPELHKNNIEKVLGIKLTPAQKAAMGKNWKVDISDQIAELALEAGVAPYGNAKARAYVWTFPDKIPMHREPLHTPRYDLAQKYPTYADKKNEYRVDTRFISVQKKDWSKEFPLNLVTARISTHSGAGLIERSSKYLTKHNPEMFCDINPNLAMNHGIKDGDMMWIHSPEGTKIKVKARFTYAVSEDRIFLPFHWAGFMQGVDLSANYPEGTKPYSIGESANTVTNYGYDIVTQIPETKGGLCRIEKV